MRTLNSFHDRTSTRLVEDNPALLRTTARQRSRQKCSTPLPLLPFQIFSRDLCIFFPFAQVTASVNESIPAYPMMFGNGNVTDLSSAANSVGIMRNGVALFRHVEYVL